MEKYLSIFFLMIQISGLSFAIEGEVSSKRKISFDTFTIPKNLLDQNAQFIQHSMDIILSDNQSELILGTTKLYKQLSKLSLVIIETTNGFYGEVKVYDLKKNEFSGVVSLTFQKKEQAIEKVRIAVTEVLLGKKYVLDNMAEIKEKAKIRYPSRKTLRINDVLISTKDTILLSKEFNIKPESIIEDKIILETGKIPKTEYKIELKQPIQSQKPIENNGLVTNQKNNKTDPQAVLPSLKSSKTSHDSKQKKSDIPLEPEVLNNLIFDAFVFSGQLEVITEKNIKVTTNIAHLGFGVRARQIQVNIKKPWELSAELQIAKPIKTDNYILPMWRKLDFYGIKKDIEPFLGFGGGLEMEPLYFISLPIIGAGLNVIANTIIWGQVIYEFNIPDYKDQYVLNLKLSKSFFTSSNTETKLVGYKFNLNFDNKLSKNYTFGIKFQKSFLKDEESNASNRILSANIRYQF
ncbi:MAG: hypothetical protein HOP07_04395 [Bacteriovoracaceae bacterium]|nr:hypothetical protein [Bacteriovoracaceae bacterium]